MLRIVLQVLGVLVLLLLVTIVTLRFKHSGDDGPSILFPGGALVSGDLHSGPDPDWAVTDDEFTIELALEDPQASRRIFVMHHDGKIYVPSGYMKSFLGRIWKDWAFQADEGDGLAVARIAGVRYERQLVRVRDEEVLRGVAQKLAAKYAGGATQEAVSEVLGTMMDEETWIFELAPRG